jgi:hypothetical protein
MQSNFWAGSKKLDRHFGTCKRTRHYIHIYQVIFKILLTSQHPTHRGRKIKNLGLRVILTKRVAAANRGTTDRKLEELYGAIFCKLARK